MKQIGCLLLSAMIMASLPSRGQGEAREIASPDGRRVAYVGRRAADGWFTLFLKLGSHTRDLLPGDAGGKLGSPGRRSIALGVWLNNGELSFQYHCGTGCVGIYKIDVDTRRIVELWTGEVDSGVHWSPRGDRALVGTHLGGLLMISSDGTHTEVPGCRIVNYNAMGSLYLFEEWMADGTSVRVRKLGCKDLEKRPSGGERLVWDGHSFSPPIQ